MFADAFDAMPLDELKPANVKAWLADLAVQDYGGYTCQGARSVARNILRDARAEFLLPHDLCDRVKNPKPIETYDDNEAEPNSLDASQLQAFFVAHRSTEPRLFPLVATMAMTGLRPGEASALEWGDIDFAKGEITITRTQYRRAVGTVDRGVGGHHQSR